MADYAGYYVEIDWDDPCFYDDLLYLVKEEMQGIFPSFWETEKWDHGGRVVLENSLAQVVFADNETSVAVYVVIPDTERFPYPELGKKKLANYLAKLKVILLKNYPGKVRFRTGPWTSGVLRAAV